MSRAAHIVGLDARQGGSVGPAGGEWLFRLRNVACTFGGQGGVLVERLEIAKGCITAIMGRSGSGKSTLLHLLGGMLAPDAAPPGQRVDFAVSDAEGRAYDVAGQGCWPRLRRRIGFVFQDPVLFRDASCRTNLATSLAAAGLPIDHARIEGLWNELGLDRAKLDQPARSLSGGMQQRVAVARALIRDPWIIFADEPIASLDPASGDAVMALLQAWQRRGAGRSLLLITHDTVGAARSADEIVVLSLPPRGAEDPLVGRLSGARAWPAVNPGNAATLRSWMEEAALPSGFNEIGETAPPVVRATRPMLVAQRTQGALP